MKNDHPHIHRRISVAATGLAIFLLIAAGACTLPVDPPDSMRFSAGISVLDTTASGAERTVEGAQVILQSITYGDRYEAVSDSSGIALFSDLLPDRYNILATGRRISGLDYLIFNGQLQDTALYAGANDTLRLELPTHISKTSALLISEIYYTGAIPNPVPQYFHDQFLELYNNSDQTLYLDSLIIADLDGGFIDDSLLHCVHAYMFPGSGTDYPIGPGEFMVIAQDAIDHSLPPINSVNLENADFEYYVSDKGDVDNPHVTNMIQIHHKYGVDFLYSVFNNALVVLKTDDPYRYGYDGFERLLIPKRDVIDGVEYRANTSQVNTKYLDSGIDGGMTGDIPSYSNKSVERRIESLIDDRIIFMDNNNSSIDFIVLEIPTPGFCNQEVPQ
jgi:hypothetical protein